MEKQKVIEYFKDQSEARKKEYCKLILTDTVLKDLSYIPNISSILNILEKDGIIKMKLFNDNKSGVIEIL